MVRVVVLEMRGEFKSYGISFLFLGQLSLLMIKP